MNGGEIINVEIKLLKEKFDFLDKLENMIKKSITGFELVYELEEFSDAMKKRLIEMERNGIFIKINVDSEVSDADIIRHGILKKIGKDKVFNYKLLPDLSKYSKESHERILKRHTRKIGNECLENIKKNKFEILNSIAYKEFLKHKPKPKEIKEKIEYEKDLDDFIGFLDEKFKEWEKIKTGKKD